MFFMRIISLLHPRKYVAPLLLLVSLLASPSLITQWVPLNPVTSVDPQPDTLKWRPLIASHKYGSIVL